MGYIAPMMNRGTEIWWRGIFTALMVTLLGASGFVVVFVEIPPANQNLANQLFGALIVLSTMSIQWWYNDSREALNRANDPRPPPIRPALIQDDVARQRSAQES